MTQDVVFIRDLAIQAILGVLPAERDHPQRVLINLQIFTDIRKAATSTELIDTVDYAWIANEVEALAQAQRCLLVESLVEAIADMVLGQPGVTAVEVEVVKPDALKQAGAVGVRIYRSC
ncbi:MAG: dihydroneopterin aldolase [Pseudomonadota bacterium]